MSKIYANIRSWTIGPFDLFTFLTFYIFTRISGLLVYATFYLYTRPFVITWISMIIPHKSRNIQRTNYKQSAVSPSLKCTLLVFTSVTDFGCSSYTFGSVMVPKRSSPVALHHLSSKLITNTYHHWYLSDPVSLKYVKFCYRLLAIRRQANTSHSQTQTVNMKYTTLNNSRHTRK
jgi:hypothetical protein